MDYIILLFPVMIRSCWDAITIDVQHKPINYLKHNIVTGVMACFCCLALLTRLQGHFFSKEFLYLLLLQFGVYAALFDYVLNWMRGKSILKYYGNPLDIDDQSFLEKWVLQKLRWQVLLVAKALLLITVVYLYVKAR